MTELADQDGYPLSSPQELWYSGDQGDQAGFFGSGFVLAGALRISGRVDTAALHAALDALVVRHEILRTTVVRDVEPPHQRVDPPGPVAFQVRDVPVPPGPRRAARAEKLLAEAEQRTVDPREAPVLRAVLARFDDTDSVLTVTVHHTAVDEWSMQVIVRDLAALYAGGGDALPEPAQYREFSEWQRAAAASGAGDAARAYWRERMNGARIFAVPTDRPVPDAHTMPCTAHHFTVGPDTMAAARAVAEAEGAPVKVVLAAAFNVLAHEIAGTTDQAIDTLTTGRADPRFDDTVGPVMNFLVFRTDIGAVRSFREVVAATRDVWTEAFAHEIPIQHIEWEAPHVMEPNEEALLTHCIVGYFDRPFPEPALQVADGSYEITRRALSTPVGPWIPHGVAWSLQLVAGDELAGRVQYNREDLDDSTVAGWAAAYRRILAAGAADPDQAWKAV
jgi:condensation enzyme